MKKLHTTALATVITAAMLAGCAADGSGMSETGRNTAIGAGIGALAGAAIDSDKRGRGALIGAGVGAAGGYIWSQHMQQKKAAMERATMGSGVNVVQTADNQLRLDVPSDISFASGRADINPRLRPILDQFASGLSSQQNTEVRIVGHTDNVGSDQLNDRLSLDRAESVRSYLVTRGVRANSVQVSGRGEREPVADNSTESGRARNRRVEIFLGERANVAGR